VLGDSQAQRSLPGGQRLKPQQARRLLADNAKLLHVLGKTSKEVDEDGRKLHSPDRLRPIQSGNTDNRIQESLAEWETDAFFQDVVGLWNSAWLFERLMGYNVLHCTFSISQIAEDFVDAVLAMLDLEDAFPLLLWVGLWAVYAALGAGAAYIEYRKRWYVAVVNTLVFKGVTADGPGIEEGCFQGSVHSTKDMLTAGSVIVSRTRSELEARTLRCRLEGYADDWTMVDWMGVQGILVLFDTTDQAEEALGTRFAKKKILFITRTGTLSDQQQAALEEAGITEYTVAMEETLLGVPVGFDVAPAKLFARARAKLSERIPLWPRTATGMQQRIGLANTFFLSLPTHVEAFFPMPKSAQTHFNNA
jgi:hypothetical protein